MAERIDVPPDVRAVAQLSEVHYADAFSALTTVRRAPEDWVRAGFVAAPLGLMGFARSAQRALGLDLDPADHAHPLGWTVLRSDGAYVVLGAHGSGADGRIVGSVVPGRFVLTTLLQFHDRRARLLWKAVQPAHRAAARLLIDRGARTLPVGDGPG